MSQCVSEGDNMKVFSCWLCVFFLSALLSRSHAEAGTLIFTELLGANLTFLCPLAARAAGTFFCREPCDEGDVLIESSSHNAQNARYGIGCEAGGLLEVRITQLTKSDSGRYRCGFGKAASSTLFRQTEIFVVDAKLSETHYPPETTLHATAGSSVSVRCHFAFSGKQKWFCKELCREDGFLVNTDRDAEQRGRHSIKYLNFQTSGRLYVSITQLTTADSGRYRCGLDSSSLRFEVVVTETESATEDPGSDVWPTASVVLSVTVPLAIAGVLASVAALTFCTRSRRRAEGVRSRGATRGTNKEATLYENDPRYLRLDPATRDLDQSYCTLAPTQCT